MALLSSLGFMIPRHARDSSSRCSNRTFHAARFSFPTAKPNAPGALLHIAYKVECGRLDRSAFTGSTRHAHNSQCSQGSITLRAYICTYKSTYRQVTISRYILHRISAVADVVQHVEATIKWLRIHHFREDVSSLLAGDDMHIGADVVVAVFPHDIVGDLQLL